MTTKLPVLSKENGAADDMQNNAKISNCYFTVDTTNHVIFFYSTLVYLSLNMANMRFSVVVVDIAEILGGVCGDVGF